MSYHATIDDFEVYVLKSTDTKPTFSSDDVLIIEYDTGKRFINKNGVWEPYVGTGEETVNIGNEPNVKVISEVLTKSDNITKVNLADSYYKDEQIVGSIGDRSLRQGNMFAVGYMASSVASNASIILHIKSGAKPLYITYEVIGTALTEYGGYLNPTITTNGIALTPFKRNLVTPYTELAMAYHTPTYSNIGTLAMSRFLGSGVNPTSRVGGADSTQYVILPTNSSIFFVAKNVATASQDRMVIYANWFEINGEL